MDIDYFSNRELREMGFKKLGSSVILPDNECTRGQIRQIAHMVRVEDAE